MHRIILIICIGNGILNNIGNILKTTVKRCEVWYYMVFIIVTLLFLLLCYCSILLFGFKQVSRAGRYNDELCFNTMKKYNLDIKGWFEKLSKEDAEVTSRDNLKLKGFYIWGNRAQNKTIIIVHGYMVSSIWSLQFAKIFLENGWSVLLVDQRKHGRSDGKYSTYGYMEKYDLDSWVNYVIQRNGTDCLIGLHGQSMGGGTVLEYASINKYVKFIIADCPYSDVQELIRYQLKIKHIPLVLFYRPLDFLLSHIAGFRMADVSPVNSIKDSDIPVLFIHGGNDKFVPTHMSEDMYKVKRGLKKLLIVDNAIHGNSYLVNRDLYEREMLSFIDEVLI